MKVINNKKILTMIIGSLLLVIVGGLLIWNLNSANETKLEEVSLKNNKVDSNMFAIMLEEIDEEGNSTYVESSDNMWPSLKYKYNTTNSGCLDENGTNIPDILSYDAKNQKAIVRTRSVAYCYLYFDIDESVYAKVRNDYTDNKGALLLSETESDEYPVYYYNGNITNNNILYANFCWKMVRTTETGGVKLIYNGVPDEAEDGTLTCDNTGEESQIGTSKFNSSYNSLSYAGYMYNKVYSSNTKSLQISKEVVDPHRVYYSYYYGDMAIWNEETSQYVLSNSDGSEVTTYVWADNYSTLKGKYTCLSTTETKCSSVYYIAATDNKFMYVYILSEELSHDDYVLELAPSVTDNGDGTYTLVNPIEVTYLDYVKNYNGYKNYYICDDTISLTCKDMLYITAPHTVTFAAYNMANIYKYGNSFKYENGTYKLVDTNISSIMQFWNWKENYNKINNNHYTCFNESGECENVYYIYYTNNTYAYYIALSDGKSVEDALNEMLYAEDVNATDSTIKAYIDEWYKNNIVNVLDSNDKLYANYLENTIFCNNRATTNLSSSGWDPNGGSTSIGLYFDRNSLECSNKTDRFTLKVGKGGTEGYGNNALDYPIGLISYKEASLATASGYLNSESSYFLFSPRIYHNIFEVSLISSSGTLNGDYYPSSAYGIRPSVSLSNKVEILSGNGEVDNPYHVKLSS